MSSPRYRESALPCSFLVIIDFILACSLTVGEDKVVGELVAPKWLEDGELKALAVLDAVVAFWGAYGRGSASVRNSGSGIFSTWS